MTLPLPTATELDRLIAGTLMPGFQGLTVPAWIEAALADGLASVCLYGANLDTPEQLAALAGRLRSLSPGALITLDEEGGDVTRLHYLTGSPQPGNAVLGRLDDEAATASSAALIAAELAGLGLNLDLAPDADVNSSPQNPVIGSRSFGAEPELVARHTVAWVSGLQGAGVAACVKHFPGHGDTTADSHLAMPRIDVDLETLHARELVPFRAAIAAGVATVMTSHILVPALDPSGPATFSRAILTDLLRDELGFEGVIVTDALDMKGASGEVGIPEAAVRALIAGADLLCLGSETSPELYAQVLDAVGLAVREARLPLERLRDAAGRTARLAAAYPAVDDAAPAGSVPSAATIASAFRLGPAVAGWVCDPAPAAVVQFENEANMAVGFVPWGAGAAGVPLTQATAVPSGAKVALVARGLDAAHPAWELASRLEAAGHRVLVTECGWPRNERPDVVTFGASRAVGEALVLALGLPAVAETGAAGGGGIQA
ncbi:MAG: hypothetical protein LBE25_05650 [Arthrobacter sp.]|jgi:beta-N-acetylhexosaminidase|nr:hypothetical protein [Arthrobacter sp.]